jgi:hypothetical protein
MDWHRATYSELSQSDNVAPKLNPAEAGFRVRTGTGAGGLRKVPVAVHHTNMNALFSPATDELSQDTSKKYGLGKY